jgi:magnesium-transporting ATPase (P-type)
MWLQTYTTLMTTSDDTKKLAGLQAHDLSIDEALKILKSRREGLTTDEAQIRLKELGPNRLPEPQKEGVLKRFFKHFHDILIYILIAAAMITAALGHWVDTWVIAGVVFINAIIGFIQEGKAEAALEGIRKMLSLHAQVMRNKKWHDIEAENLVAGDIIRIKSGDRVPADIRLIETTNLRIEESALTGESLPAEKNQQAVAANAGVGDRHGMAYSGSLVAAGRGLGVVAATGIHTEIGRINTMISNVETLATPLTRQMNRFGKALSVVILVLASLMFGAGWFFHEFSIAELFLASIGFAVAAIPEGLPAIMTITLAIGVQRMAKRNAITRRLTAVETLGSVTVICSDKTGTLTRNEMTARHVVSTRADYDIEGTGYVPEGQITQKGEPQNLESSSDLAEIIEVMALCNDANISLEDGQWIVVGEATEGALRTLSQKAGFEEEAYKRIAAIPFESVNKFMATLHQTPSDEKKIFFKGAPDKLLDRCQLQRAADGSIEELDASFWKEKIEKLGADGLRVLAAAVRIADPKQSELAISDLDKEMVFLGLVGIVDPPRPEAIEAIKVCKRAGIQVKMITGDHVDTARAIAQEMGISDGEAISGAELELATDEELRAIVDKTDIFARASPEHKLRLVQALQANGEVVAMTGDGVNDAPALKRADVGVAMGIKGTEATKEAAEIVLADDNFASILQAVKEGRNIYDNLRKAILFILPTNGAEGLVIMAAVIFGFALPLTPVQILWVNMVTALTLALALSFEPAEPKIMDRAPRSPKASILDRYALWRIAYVSALIGGGTLVAFLGGKLQNFSLEEVRTVAVNTLVVCEVFYLINSRFLFESSLKWNRIFSNRVALIAIGSLAMMQLAFVYLPFFNRAFGTAPIKAEQWLVSLGVGLAVFVLVEIEKTIMRRRALSPSLKRTFE